MENRTNYQSMSGSASSSRRGSQSHIGLYLSTERPACRIPTITPILGAQSINTQHNGSSQQRDDHVQIDDLRLPYRADGLGQDARPPAQARLSASNTGPGSRKRLQIPDSVWDTHRDTLQNLYIKENKTLKDTMLIMEEQHKFFATEKMFKDKFKEWGDFNKNLKRHQLIEIMEKARDRRGCKTEVLIQGRPIRMSRVERSYCRLPANAVDMTVSTPADQARRATGPETNIIVRTPEAVPVPVSTDIAFAARSYPVLGGFALPYSTIASNFLDSVSLRADGRGLSLDELLSLRKRSLAQLEKGQSVSAVNHLQQVLSGLCVQFVHINPIVVETAWNLIDAHCNNDDQHQATIMMNWISKCYSNSLGLWHPRTLNHYIRIAEKLQDLGRPSHAEMLGNSFLIAIQDGIDALQIVPVVWNSEVSGQLLSATDLGHFWVDCSDELQVCQQVKLAKLCSTARVPGMEEILELLIFRHENTRFGMELRLMLIRLHIVNGKGLNAASDCRLARAKISKLILECEDSDLLTLFSQCRELAAVHAIVEDRAGHDRVLNWTSNQFQQKVTLPTKGGHQKEQIRLYVDHLIAVGRDLEGRSNWEHASPWLERALGIAIKYLGAKDNRSLTLQTAMRNKAL